MNESGIKQTKGGNRAKPRITKRNKGQRSNGKKRKAIQQVHDKKREKK